MIRMFRIRLYDTYVSYPPFFVLFIRIAVRKGPGVQTSILVGK
jgi:hypothetical protein